MDISFNSRRIPEQFNLNLQSKRMKTGDVNFPITPLSLNYPYLMQLAKQIKQGYPQGEGTFEYRDPEFRFYIPQVDWSQVLRTQPLRSPQTYSSATSW